jgi:hypothetical protein
MSHKQNYIDAQKRDCREHWFKDHKATRISVVNGADFPQIIDWSKPGTWTYGCRFIIYRRWLCVVGDIGEATFEWSEDLTLDFLAQIDFGYFLSKCRASPSGKDFDQWDIDVLELYRVERLAELKQRAGTDDEAEEDKDELDVLENNSRCVKDWWESAVRDYYDATGDAEGASSLMDYGKVPSVHAIGIFVGLQMAIAQLKSGI